MLFIAHRGASAIEPENTLRSFKKAASLGADMIELDVRTSREGEMVIIHDATLKRLFGIDKPVANTSLAELKDISRAKGREIPTLDEVLSNIKADLDIDLKVHGIEKELLAKLKRFSHKVLISSIYPGVLKKIRALDEKIQLGLIVGRGELHLLPVLNRITSKLKLTSIHPKSMIVTKTMLPVLRATKRKIYVWTVNEPNDYERIVNFGVDGIITDCIQEFKK